MDQAAARASDIAVLAFEDGLGRRYRVQTGGDRDVHLEVLCFRPELTDIPSFEFALRERVGRLSTFQHAYYARIRRVDRLNGGTLALFSECTPGVRLAELLTETERRGLVLDINTALCVLRQLAPAVALLHQSAHVANGALGPERLILTPQARLVIVEFAVGAPSSSFTTRASVTGRTCASRCLPRLACRGSTSTPTWPNSASWGCRWCSAALCEQTNIRAPSRISSRLQPRAR